MKSAEIQQKVYEWATLKGFTAPYGILTGEHRSQSGKPYKSVTFGYARTRDFEVQIYNKNFLIFRDSSVYNNRVFKSYADLQQYLDTL